MVLGYSMCSPQADPFEVISENQQKLEARYGKSSQFREAKSEKKAIYKLI